VSREEQNKQAIRRVYEEFVNQGMLSGIDEIYDPGVVDHQPLPGAPPGRDGIKYTIAGLRAGFPDLHVTIEEISAHAEFVVIHNTWRGTHLGDFLGMAATGRTMDFRGVVVWRLANGLIAERWGIGVESNMLGALGMRRLAPARSPRAQRSGTAATASQLLPILPGKAERWRELQDELAGPRLRDYEESRRRVGVVHESFHRQDWDGAQLAVHTLEARDPARAARRLRDSDHPFDAWLRDAAIDVHGFDPWSRLTESRAESGLSWSVPAVLTPVEA
jgi:predicted ester cyclase